MTPNLLDEQQKHFHEASNESAEFEFYHQCHDATLALALALNSTIEGTYNWIILKLVTLLLIYDRADSFEQHTPDR